FRITPVCPFRPIFAVRTLVHFTQESLTCRSLTDQGSNDNLNDMKKHSIFTMALLLSMGAMAQTSVKGVVYADQNANGKKEGRENGIANVAVTNGIQVVLTDEKGRYELPLSEDQIISVIKPSQYGVPVDGNNLPQFFYIHKPAGSPKLQYAGVAPTGKLPRSVDFGLLPREEDSKFTALIFGDPQPYTLEEVDYFAR